MIVTAATIAGDARHELLASGLFELLAPKTLSPLVVGLPRGPELALWEHRLGRFTRHRSLTPKNCETGGCRTPYALAGRVTVRPEIALSLRLAALLSLRPAIGPCPMT